MQYLTLKLHPQKIDLNSFIVVPSGEYWINGT